METFVWDQHFVTGLPTVDEQHRALVDLINHLGDRLVNGASHSDGDLESAFNQLTDYAKYHFADEEGLMERMGIDEQYREHHHGMHHRFMFQVLAMWNSRHAVGEPARILQEFLAAWLSFHILGEDQVMARQIRRIRDGESPAEAYAAENKPADNATSALLKALRNVYQILSQQNRDLADANRRLEERVTERTEELAQANRALTDANRQLEKRSLTDGLLGIANRRCFNETLLHEWHRARRHREPLALLMLDVDHFKRYNDAYGHRAGDDCLKAVARATAAPVKRAADLVARYGGEELAVLLPSTDLEGAERFAQQIRANVANENIDHRASPVADRVTVSIGIAAFVPDGSHDPADLVAAADRALYAAKEGGRNQIRGHEKAAALVRDT